MDVETNSRKIIARLVAEGYEFVSSKGSHHKYRKKDGPTVIVPHPKKDLPMGTAIGIAKTVGWR